jgi:hypothetical protein
VDSTVDLGPRRRRAHPSVGGKRARLLFNPAADFPLALRFKRGEPVTLGEAFSFLSGLYFRGKLAYATRFAGPASSWVITTNRGLLSPEEPVTVADLRAFGEVDIDLDDARYRAPLERDLRRLALLGPAEVVLLGSIATEKYLELLGAAFGDRIRYPVEFVGKGDMSRGSMLLKATEAGVELTYRRPADGQ